MKEKNVNGILRKWRIEDAEDLAAALSDKKILENLRDGIPYPYTKDDAADYIRAMLAADENEAFAYAVCMDGRAVGSVSAFRGSNIHSRTAEMGYYLSEEYWGRGIMTRAVSELCETIFSETDVLRIYAKSFAENAASGRVLEKAGFCLEGILKNNAVKCGRARDMAMYALVKKM